MDELARYLEGCSEGVLRLMEGGKRRGLEELKKGHGEGSQQELFQLVAASQRAFLQLHERCRSEMQGAHPELLREVALDVQYLLYLFSRRVYELAFATTENAATVSFPPPEAYSRHYPGSGPSPAKSPQGECFLRYFGDTTYSREKSMKNLDASFDQARQDRLIKLLQNSQRS